MASFQFPLEFGSNGLLYYGFWVILIFSLISFIFLRFPLFRNTKAHHFRDLEFVAHRGSKNEGYPENTLAAFAEGINAGADCIELDVWVSKCGVVHVFHDETFDRMCGGTGGKLQETHAHELPKIKPPAEQSQHFIHDNPRHFQIPTFEEVLKELPHHIHLVVEFKSMDGDVISKVYDLLLKYNRVNGSAAWFSLDITINQHLRLHCNKMPSLVSVKEMLKVYTLYYTGLLPFARLDGLDIFGFPGDPVDKKRIKNNLKNFPDWLCHILALLAGGEPAPFFLCQPMIKHLKSRGIPVQVLGVNSHEALLAAKQAGVSTVLTDRPRWLGSIREAKGTIFH